MRKPVTGQTPFYKDEAGNVPLSSMTHRVMTSRCGYATYWKLVVLTRQSTWPRRVAC